MKKIGIVLAIVVALTLVVGCASSGGSPAGGGGGGGGGDQSYSLDLSNLEYKIFSNSASSLSGGGKGVKNTTPLASRWDGVLFVFPAFPVDVTQFKRVTINAKYYNEKGEEIAPGDGKAMVVIAYDINGDLKGPEMGSGPNTPLKEFNLGGFSGLVSTEKGVRLNLGKSPGGVLVQAADPAVKFLEITQFTLHN